MVFSLLAADQWFVSTEACVTNCLHRKGRQCIPLALLNKFSACWDLGGSMPLFFPFSHPPSLLAHGYWQEA